MRIRWPWRRRISAWEVMFGFPLRRKPNVVRDLKKHR